jgi:hypothetical protein
VQPGESGRIPLKIKTTRMSGPLQKSIQVNTNAPGAQGTIQITMKGECWMPVEVKPPSVNFGRMTREQVETGSTQKLTVVNNLDEPANLTDIRSTNPVFKAEAKPLEPGKKWEITVSLASTPEQPLRKGSISGTIEMATGVADTPTLQVPVSAIIPADVDVQPETLQLFSGRTTETQRTFTIRNSTKTPIQISDLASTSTDLQPTIQELEAGMSFRISVNIPATYQAPTAGDKITFKTTCPTMPEVIIPVTESKIAQPTIAPVNSTAAVRSATPLTVTPQPPTGPTAVRPPLPGSTAPPGGDAKPPGAATAAPSGAAPASPQPHSTPPPPEQPKPNPPPPTGGK